MRNDNSDQLLVDGTLYRFLTDNVLRKILGFKHLQPIFDVSPLDNSGSVFRYTDRYTHVDLVGKFYGHKWINGTQLGYPELRIELMSREFDNMQRVRELGLNNYPHNVSRPLAVCEPLDCLLVEEYVPGANLDFFVREAIQRNQCDQLFSKLTDLAWFLADLHMRSQITEVVDENQGLSYLNKMIEHLLYWQVISAEQWRRFVLFREHWGNETFLRQGCQVLTHGDPIPPHFIFVGNRGVTTIDLERLRFGDRAADLGCMAAELKHLFFIYSNNIWASEPYIRHFYTSYANYLPAGLENFDGLTIRGRFYMGCYLLRIGRNAWLNLDYRRRLIEEGESCLNI